MICQAPQKNDTANDGRRSRPSITVEQIADYETALDMVGYGYISKSVLIASVLAFFATGVQNCLMSYVLPSARCELSLTTYQAGLVNMAFMCGGVASAFFWGIVADVVGRKRCISTTLVLDGLVTLAQSAVNDYRILVLVRCLNGFLIGAPSTLVLSYLSDLVGVRRRQLYLNITGSAFVVAWLIVPGLAWMIIPFKPIDVPTLLPIYSWRLFLFVSSVPSLISGVWVMFLPESPRLLADTNRADQAVAILAKMYKCNEQTKQEFKVKQLIVDDMVAAKSMSAEGNRSKELFTSVLKDLKLFVSKTYALKSSLIMFVFFANMAAGFGLNMWIPELLLRVQSRPCSNNTAIEAAKLLSTNHSNIVMPFSKMYQDKAGLIDFYNSSRTNRIGVNEEVHCNSDLDDHVFTSGLIVGACCVIGNIACSLLGGSSGKGVRRSSAACALACACACACLAVTACGCSNMIAIGAAAVLNAASLNGNVLIIRLMLYALPAKLSGLGVCWGAWWGRAGGVATNVAVGALLDLSCPAPFIAVGACLALSIVGIFMISLDESVEIKEKSLNENKSEEEIQKEFGLDRYKSTHM